MKYSELLRDVKRYSMKDRARSNAWFFKTGKGEYGEGDRFRGLTMGEERKLAKMYRDLDFSDIEKLLESPWHEERMIGLLILVLRYETTKDDSVKEKVFDFYVAHRSAVNNWDLVDVTTPNIVGDFLSRRKDRSMLYKWARSKNLWERRMAMLATFRFIRSGDFADTIALSEMFLRDMEDLIHKAVGWMLREIGKRDVSALTLFLDRHAAYMPRTMLRYAIERFSPDKRRYFLHMKRM
jgi:3-methyladenine DNA glycosylase AlkD